MSGQVGCTTGNAAHGLRRLRAEHVAGKPGRSRRYFISPGAPWPASPARRTPRRWTDIDRHYKVLRLEMSALSADMGIACR